MRIAVDSYWNVAETTRRLQPDAVISIMDAAHLAPHLFLVPERHLHLGFHDVEKPQSGKALPTRDQIAKMIEFAEHHRKSGARHLLIHCMAGVSRSSAAAYILAVSVRKEDPLRAATQLFRTAPFADPNMLMIRHADELGGWKGAMLSAVRAAQGDLENTGQQHPFTV
ncbi:MAG: tyrosine phosphatase family protein [Hyphomonas sp.]